MSTIELHIESHRDLRNLDALKIYMKLAKIKFSLKQNKTKKHAVFARLFDWICKEMMILIYIESLKHITCQIFKEMDKIRITDFNTPTLTTTLFDDPHTQMTSPYFTS